MSKYNIDIGELETWGEWKGTEGRGNKGGFIVRWSAENIGFGEVSIWINEDGTLCCDNECMSDEFLAEVMLALIKKTKKTWIYKEGNWETNPEVK